MISGTREGRKDLHEGAGHDGRQAAAAETPFLFLASRALPRDNELGDSPSHPCQMLEGPRSAPAAHIQLWGPFPRSAWAAGGVSGAGGTFNTRQPTLEVRAWNRPSQGPGT